MASTFSYAQAAKGKSTPATTSKPASGSATPAKEPTTEAVPASVASARSWAEDVETEALPEQPATNGEVRPARSERSSSNAARVSRSADASSVSSPDLGASSSSTVTKDDDASSIPNTSSESTWDNKSQASTSVEKSAESTEKTSEKAKKGKNAVVKPLLEAPQPAVNIWKVRAAELKANVPKSAPQHATNGSTTRKPDSNAQGKNTTGDSSKSKARDDGSQGRKDARGDADTRKGAKGKVSEPKSAPGTLPPPPNRDQESWPTPETVIDEDRKKAQEKGDKLEKDRKDGSSSGKHEWVKVPYTPSVVFNTPLPNAASTRRGGRPGGRGGAQSGGRSTGPNTNGTGHAERDGSESDPALNGETASRERSDGSALQDASPKARRTGNPTTSSDELPAVGGEAPTKTSGTTGSEDAGLNKTSETSQPPGQTGNYARQFPNRSSKSRRGDFTGFGDRRRDDATSPTKDQDERRFSASNNAEAPGDGERRASAVPDGSNGHHFKQGRFNSISNGRERGGRGGGRGARASYSNGHQFSNGHASTQSSTFPIGPRSPTTFHPENSSFFPSSQGKYSRNAHRSQSMAGADAYRFPPFQNGPTAPPPQAFNMYDYGMMQPMAPVPYGPYGVDQFTLFAMITTQVEYYFSVDNLLKDMYLRRHMDSQGFVSLEFIAAFNRIKNLSTDLELIKLVCQQSGVIEYRTSEDGQDRLRRRDGWAQWVLNITERDESARNSGPKELHQPPVPHPAGFDQSSLALSPTSKDEFSQNVDSKHAQTNGHQPVSEDALSLPTETTNGATNGEANGTEVPNGQPLESLVKA